MDFFYEECREYFCKRGAQLYKQEPGTRMLGTGHVHRKLAVASVDDLFNLTKFGLGLIHLIHFSGNLQPEAAKIYVSESEKNVMLGDTPCHPILQQLELCSDYRIPAGSTPHDLNSGF